MKEGMAKAGYSQGDMAPKVEDYQKPEGSFPERGFSKTLDYIERKDAHEKAASSKIKGQQYNGRYS